MRSKTTDTFDIGVPPSGGDLIPNGPTLEDEAHALRVMLDKSENFKVAVGQKLLELLNDRFGGNRNALRDWYETEVVEGKAHRAWTSVVGYLQVVHVHGDRAGEVFAERDEWRREYQRGYQADLRERARQSSRTSNINNLGETEKPKISEYEQRKQWLAQMDHLWFRGQPEWRKKWLDDRGLKSAQPL